MRKKGGGQCVCLGMQVLYGAWCVSFSVPHVHHSSQTHIVILLCYQCVVNGNWLLSHTSVVGDKRKKYISNVTSNQCLWENIVSRGNWLPLLTRWCKVVTPWMGMSTPTTIPQALFDWVPSNTVEKMCDSSLVYIRTHTVVSKYINVVCWLLSLDNLLYCLLNKKCVPIYIWPRTHTCAHITYCTCTDTPMAHHSLMVTLMLMLPLFNGSRTYHKTTKYWCTFCMMMIKRSRGRSFMMFVPFFLGGREGEKMKMLSDSFHP